MELGRIVLTLNHPPTANFMLNKWHKQRICELICKKLLLRACGKLVGSDILGIFYQMLGWKILPKHWVVFKKYDLVSFSYFLHMCSLCHKKTV